LKSGIWQRRWFVLQSDGTLYHLSSRNSEDRKAVVNLCISTIKRDAKDKDRLAFSLVSPSHTYSLHAENELDRQEWINSIQVHPHAGVTIHGYHSAVSINIMCASLCAYGWVQRSSHALDAGVQGFGICFALGRVHCCC
jgi:hypothetical protein